MIKATALSERVTVVAVTSCSRSSDEGEPVPQPTGQSKIEQCPTEQPWLPPGVYVDEVGIIVLSTYLSQLVSAALLAN